MTLPDVVYVVAVGEKNEALRYSLRSLVNLPHGKVWIAGFAPSWVNLEAVGYLPVKNRPGGHSHAKANLKAACESPDVSDSFYYFNDDFFVMQPMNELPVMHRGPLDEAVRTDRMASSYQRATVKTLEILKKLGIDKPLMYDLHAPHLVTKAGMLKALALCTAPGALDKERTIYGNLEAIGGERRHNYKVRRVDRNWRTWPFLSTNDSIFSSTDIGHHIRATFSEQSEYEAVGPTPVRVRPAVPARRPVRYRMGMTSTIHRVKVPA